MSKNLFGETEPDGMTIGEAAGKASVSVATIRNWIKTGYLTQVGKGIIEKESFDTFMNEVAGKEKLTLRANKSQKDEHDHASLSELVRQKIDGSDTEALGEEYESSLSNSYRNKEGIYYTPEEIVSSMLQGIKVDETSLFLDPCCGSGNFIIGAIKLGVAPQNIYGFDTDPNAIEITRKRIFEETGYQTENIKQCNFLEEARLLIEKGSEFDLVFTNPPWGKKLKKEEKEALSNIYGAGRSLDTTSLFFFACVQLLKQQGKLGFLVQDALFNIATFQDTRKRILEYDITRIIDYGKPFKGLVTKAQAFIVRKSSGSSNGEVSCEIGADVHQRAKNSFSNNPKQVLNFWIGNEEAKAIDRIYGLPHVTLEGKAQWALGIVTGNNSRYCKSELEENHVPVFKGADITPSGLKPPTNFIPDDFSIYQQVAPLSMYRAAEKLIYKFISSNLVFYHDRNQSYILNSANLVIPDADLGVSAEVLCSLFNSEITNWLFRSLFNTHKVLRGDIEQLPVHLEYFQNYKVFSESTYLDYLGIIKMDNGTFRVKE